MYERGALSLTLFLSTVTAIWTNSSTIWSPLLKKWKWKVFNTNSSVDDHWWEISGHQTGLFGAFVVDRNCSCLMAINRTKLAAFPIFGQNVEISFHLSD